jgi:hypothetical protein
MPVQLPDKLTLQNGIVNIKNLIAEAPPGTYDIKFECKNMSLKTASLILTITSGPSLSPVRYFAYLSPSPFSPLPSPFLLHVCSVPSTCIAGTTLPVSVIQLLTHDGEKNKVDEKRVSLEFNKTTYLYILIEIPIILISFDPLRYSCIMDSSDSTYHFSNVPCPTKSGSYELKFQCKNVK